MSGWDRVINEAVARATQAISKVAGQSDVGELAHLQPALSSALNETFGRRVRTGVKIAALPDWKPQPGGVDVLIDRQGTLSPILPPLVGIELKSSKLDETIWDIFKMASLGRVPDVEATYIVVAATAKKFASHSDGAALFNSTLEEAVDWKSASFISQWPKAWNSLMKGGRGRPTRVPEMITLQLTSICDIPAFPNWQVRTLRVENPANHGWHRIKYSGWPDDQAEPDATTVGANLSIPRVLPPPQGSLA